MRYEGILKSWNDERGFGFIEPLESREDVFVHVRGFRRGVGQPQVGQAMSFEVEVSPEGKKRAKNVELITAGRISTGRISRRPPGRLRGTSSALRSIGTGGARLLAISLFLILYLVLTVFWALPFFTGLIYVGVSLITFVVYLHDKAAAVQSARRTSELTLLALGLAGGWPGALLAQQFVRHKSAKLGFQIEFWCTVVMNIVALVFFCFVWAALSNP